ncbi:two-component system sporulation sensor kinase A [Cytobacillus firmus]|uniref:histidine kinase n=2 Tax=Cytobacillus TaxID=2675230 RepID=A0A366JJU8_CYTFI|nr:MULTISPECIES: PAS domain-containing sensor histidine kinase [Cytobacillus]RBP86102.1 two-component system sporulation sensor kinase A [Cytobacillus firmus]TDX35444.1 two-component system sporulation sensor kinase A [Cytobacillus oceanisediminis]
MNSSTFSFKEKRQLLLKYLEVNPLHYKSIIDCTPDIVFVIDIEGQIIKPNRAFEKLSGYSSEELTQMTLQKLMGSKHADKSLHHFELALKGSIQNFDCSIFHSNQNRVDLKFTLFPVVVGSEILGVYGVAKDITEIKHTRRKLDEKEFLYQLLKNNSLGMITTTGLDGDFIYISPAFLQILGYTPDELLGTTSFGLIHSEDLEKARSNLTNVLKKKEIGVDTYRVRKKNGGYIWVECLCKPLIDFNTNHVKEIISVIRDISDRKKAEEDIRNSEARYRNIIEHTPDAIIVVKDSIIVFSNDSSLELLGAATKEELQNKSIFDFLHKEYITSAQRRIHQVMNGQTVDFKDYKIYRMDGSILEVEVKPVSTVFQNEPAIHLFIRDISKRIQTQQLLLQSEKLTVAGQLAAGIAHEIRNPLTAIKGFLQLMEAKLTDDKTYFDIITSEMDRIEIILSELLTLAKPQDMKFVKSDIEQILESVKTLIDTQALMNNIEIITLYETNIFSIFCDENQLKQVFINFLKNSIEAMPDGGKITIELRSHGIDKLKLLFIDEGSGIPDHILNRIYEPFFTTKETGTGLGLMISKQIIENHNGTLQIRSDKKGTIVEVILPIF